MSDHLTGRLPCLHGNLNMSVIGERRVSINAQDLYVGGQNNYLYGEVRLDGDTWTWVNGPTSSLDYRRNETVAQREAMYEEVLSELSRWVRLRPQRLTTDWLEQERKLQHSQVVELNRQITQLNAQLSAAQEQLRSTTERLAAAGAEIDELTVPMAKATASEVLAALPGFGLDALED